MARPLRHIFLIISFLHLCDSVRAQQYNFTRYSVNDGLAQSQVFSILQDSRGYLWLGTRGGGISRFDGQEFRNYSTREGLSNSYIWCLAEDRDGNLWIGTDAGLVRYNGLSFELIRSNGMDASARVLYLAFDDKGNLWISTSTGLLKFNGKEFLQVRDGENKKISGSSVILHDSKGNSWVGDDQGLLLFSGGTVKRLGKKEGLQNLQVRTLCEDEDGNIWIGTYGGGVFIYGGKQIRRPEKMFELRNKIIHGLYKDSKGDIWVCTHTDGIYRVHPSDSTLTLLSESDGLSNNHVRTVREDTWGNYWIGTSGGGICKYSGQQFSHFSRENGLPGDFIHSVFTDVKGKIWTGVADKGICLYDSAKFRNWSGANGFRDVKVKCIAYGPDSSLWLGTEGNGIFAYDSGGFRSVREFNGKFVRDMCRDENGNMWVATAGAGIFKALMDSDLTQIRELRNYTTKNGLPSNRVNALHIDRNGKVWFGTESGGAGNIQFDSIILRYDRDVGLVDNNVRCLEEDGYGNLWIGTNEYGINVFPLYSQMEKADTINTDDGLSSSNIYLMLYDGQGNMYVGTEKGIDILALDPGGRIREIRHQGKAEGFKGIETNQNAAARDSSGNIWFGTVSGLTMLNPKTTIRNSVPPRLSITGISLFYNSILDSRFASFIGNWMQVKETLVFNHDENHLGFEFNAINLPNPQGVKYSWILEGNDKDWSPQGPNRNVTYSNLQPGEYCFKVKAVNEDGVWSTEMTVLRFTVLPPFWSTWWFITAMSGLGILIIAAIFRIRLMQVRRRSEIMRRELQMEKDLLELEQKALRLQMNPHFIFNALNSIQGLIAQKDDKTARFYLAKFSRLMRLILDNSRQPFITLRTEVMTLENYLSLEKFCSGDSFQYAVNCPEEIDRDVVVLPPMMIQPFVENAVIHGIKHKEGTGFISVDFALKDNVLECSVTDNGIGRAKAAEMNAQRDQQHKSTALAVTQERLDILNQGSGIRSFEVTDLYDPEGHAAGTRVVLRVVLSSGIKQE